MNIVLEYHNDPIKSLDNICKNIYNIGSEIHSRFVLLEELARTEVFFLYQMVCGFTVFKDSKVWRFS